MTGFLTTRLIFQEKKDKTFTSSASNTVLPEAPRSVSVALPGQQKPRQITRRNPLKADLVCTPVSPLYRNFPNMQKSGFLMNSVLAHMVKLEIEKKVRIDNQPRPLYNLTVFFYCGLVSVIQ